MELIPNTDFGQTLTNKSDSDYRRLRDNFDKFCKQPLTLGTFVPCDEDGDVLEEPKNPKKSPLHFKKYDEYVKAKECVLFEGFEVEKFGKSGEVWKLKGDKVKINIFKFPNGNYEFYVEDWSKAAITSQEVRAIEDLVAYNLTLTQAAIKQINE